MTHRQTMWFTSLRHCLMQICDESHTIAEKGELDMSGFTLDLPNTEAIKQEVAQELEPTEIGRAHV